MSNSKFSPNFIYFQFLKTFPQTLTITHTHTLYSSNHASANVNNDYASPAKKLFLKSYSNFYEAVFSVVILSKRLLFSTTLSCKFLRPEIISSSKLFWFLPFFLNKIMISAHLFSLNTSSKLVNYFVCKSFLGRCVSQNSFNRNLTSRDRLVQNSKANQCKQSSSRSLKIHRKKKEPEVFLGLKISEKKFSFNS